MNVEKCTLPNTTKEQWLSEVIDDGIGYLKITDDGGNYFIYDDSRFYVKHHGITREYYKTKRVTKQIFRDRISKYQNVEHDGYRYYYDRGTWKRVKQELTYD